MGKAARLKAERRRIATADEPVPIGAQEVSYPVEHQAAHEAGHGVVQWTLGLPFDYISLDTTPPGVWPVAGVKLQLGDRWLIGAAGCIADFQSRNLTMMDVDILKLLLGSPDGRFTLTDRAGNPAAQPDRQPGVAPGADLHLMALAMSDDGDGRPWPAPEIISVWRECENYVAACTPAIREVTARLLASRTLTYAETARIAAEALTGIRRPSMPDWFEDAQELGRRLEVGSS